MTATMTSTVATTEVQQIDAFKEKVKICAQDYSVTSSADKLYQILAIDPQANCILGLRSFLDHVKSTSKTRDLLLYAKWYLDSIDYLRELRTNFKTRIYVHLDQKSGSKKRKRSPFKGATSQQLNNVSDQLMKIMTRLNLLLDKEGAINVKLFSIESGNTSLSTHPMNVQALARLIPDALYKLKLSAQLATDWLTVEATRRMENQNKAVMARQPKVTLIDQLSQIDEEIKAEEIEFDHASEELQCLLEREERVSAISSESHALDIKLNSLLDKQSITEHEISSIKTLLGTADSNLEFKEKLQQDMRSRQTIHRELEHRIKVLEFQKGITIEDLCIELEIKPSWIRSANNLQDRCISLESSLEAKKLERQKLELALKRTAVEYYTKVTE